MTNANPNRDPMPFYGYPNRPVRRTILVGIAMSCLPLPNSFADEPETQLAKRNSIQNIKPIASRTIRLDPVTARLPRAVVTAIASDPRGELIAVSGDDHAIRVLDSSTMRVVKTVNGHRDLIRTLAFDRDGSRLVSAGNDGQLIVWDRDKNFKVLQSMQGTPALTCVRFSPSGDEMAAVGFDNAVYMIGQRTRDNPVFECDCRDLRAVTYRDDGRVLAVAGRSGELHVFDPRSGKLLFEKSIHDGRIHDLEFHRDANTLVSVAEDGTLVVFDTKSGTIVHRVRVSTGKLFAVSILNSTSVAVAGSDNVVRVVDTDAGRVVRRLEGHQGSVPTLAFHDGKLFSGGFDATLRRWSLDNHLEHQERIAEGDHPIDR